MRLKAWKAMGAASMIAAASTAAQANLIITPSAGYSITWDGNDGALFDPSNPAPAPANLSTDSGASAFGTPPLNVGPHTTADLVRNGTFGNVSSWIGAATATPYVGVALGGQFDLDSLAWGRDNGNSAEGAQLVDRSLGVYTVQVTNSVTPSTTTSWTTIGTLNYVSSDDAALGGSFTSYYRHQYGVSATSGPLTATGVRLLVPASGIGSGTAIDELEIYGQATAQPVSQTGLRSWLMADGDVTTGGGGAITQMGDHSFHSNHATPGSSPTLVSNSINGLAAASFAGGVQHLNVPVLGAAQAELYDSDYEMFVIARSSNAGIQFLTAASSGAGVGAYELHLNGSAGARFIPSTTATASPDTFADIGVGGMFTDGRTHLYNTRVSGGLGYLRVVGMENGDTVLNAKSLYNADSRLTLGVRGDASFSFIGQMGEVLIYNRALTAAERREVERYLARKWNAPLNVASQTQGGVAFANQLFAGGANVNHQTDHLNNALYGNSESWLGTSAGGGGGFAGVKFDDEYSISSLAFGRAANSSNTDRSLGTYTFQYTLDDFDATSLASISAATWVTFLTIVYDGTTVTPWLRHQYDFATIDWVRGVRVLLSSDTIAIDELEVYGLVSVPTPGGAAMIGAIGLLAMSRRRRSAA